MSQDRCTGHCCEKFSLPVSPMELQHQAKRAAIGKSRFQPEEIRKIADMVIFLGTADVGTPHETVRGIQKLKPGWDWRSRQGRQWIYTCRHFDKASGNCTNYENRPMLCRSYPDGGTCGYRGCTSPCATPKKGCSQAVTTDPKQAECSREGTDEEVKCRA